MKENLNSYPKGLQILIKHPQYFGRMNAPDGTAVFKGLCGDEMEFYLVIKDEIIQDVKFFTNGCGATIACGEITARLAKGKSIDSALGISPRKVKDILKELPADHNHCTILAVITLYRAIAGYLLQK